MNEKLEKYISELPAELQEKARQCKDIGELSQLVAENDIELPDDALEMVAGGFGNPCDSDKPEPNARKIEENFRKNQDNY
ncbi:MAG: hypothetical protein IJ740_09955 [Ruminococcus sp.]|nr:hypothetical protein [Ruminococcus sp.]